MCVSDREEGYILVLIPALQVYEEVLPSPSRKRRSLDDGEGEDEAGEQKAEQPRLFRHKRSSYSDDIPPVEGHSMNHEVDEVEYGEEGQVRLRRRRRASTRARKLAYTYNYVCV